MNRVLIRVYVPVLEKQFDVWIPISKSIYSVILDLLEGINSINKIEYNLSNFPNLYNKENSEVYDLGAKIIETDIRNGSEVILF